MSKKIHKKIHQNVCQNVIVIHQKIRQEKFVIIFVAKILQKSSKKCVKKFVPKEPLGHQSNNESCLIYKVGPSMPGQSRFLEAALVWQADGKLKIVQIQSL